MKSSGKQDLRRDLSLEIWVLRPRNQVNKFRLVVSDAKTRRSLASETGVQEAQGPSEISQAISRRLASKTGDMAVRD